MPSRNTVFNPNDPLAGLSEADLRSLGLGITQSRTLDPLTAIGVSAYPSFLVGQGSGSSGNPFTRKTGNWYIPGSDPTGAAYRITPEQSAALKQGILPTIPGVTPPASYSQAPSAVSAPVRTTQSTTPAPQQNIAPQLITPYGQRAMGPGAYGESDVFKKLTKL